MTRSAASGAIGFAAAAQQRRDRDVTATQPRAIDVHVFGHRPPDEAVHERRHPCGDLLDGIPAGPVEAAAFAKSEARIDYRVGRPAARVGLVRDLRHPPGPAELAQHRLEGVLALEQAKEAEGTFEHRLRRGETARRHVAGDDRVTRAESDLHPEQGRALDVGLHGSRELAENGSERIDEGRGVEPGETADGRGRAERPGRGGPEEPQRAFRGDPEMACDVNPESESGQEVVSPTPPSRSAHARAAVTGTVKVWTTAPSCTQSNSPL